jgi:hypothetical protein
VAQAADSIGAEPTQGTQAPLFLSQWARDVSLSIAQSASPAHGAQTRLPLQIGDDAPQPLASMHGAAVATTHAWLYGLHFGNAGSPQSEAAAQ